MSNFINEARDTIRGIRTKKIKFGEKGTIGAYEFKGSLKPFRSVIKPGKVVTEEDLEDPQFLAELLQTSSYFTIGEDGPETNVLEFLTDQTSEKINDIFIALHLEEIDIHPYEMFDFFYLLNVSVNRIIQEEDPVIDLSKRANQDEILDILGDEATEMYGYPEQLFSVLTGTIVPNFVEEKKLKVPFETVSKYDPWWIVRMAIHNHDIFHRGYDGTPSKYPPYLLIAMEGWMKTDAEITHFASDENEAIRLSERLGIIIPYGMDPAEYFKNNIFYYPRINKDYKRKEKLPSVEDFDVDLNEARAQLKKFDDRQLLNFYEIPSRATWSSRKGLEQLIVDTVLRKRPVSGNVDQDESYQYDEDLEEPEI